MRRRRGARRAPRKTCAGTNTRRGAFVLRRRARTGVPNIHVTETPTHFAVRGVSYEQRGGGSGGANEAEIQSGAAERDAACTRGCATVGPGAVGGARLIGTSAQAGAEPRQRCAARTETHTTVVDRTAAADVQAEHCERRETERSGPACSGTAATTVAAAASARQQARRAQQLRDVADEPAFASEQAECEHACCEQACSQQAAGRAVDRSSAAISSRAAANT